MVYNYGGSGGYGAPRTPRVSDPFTDVPRLENTNYGLRNEIAAATGAPPVEEGPGILERVFDILSRGQYASAEAIRRSTDEDGASIGDFFGGAWEGLTGRAKTSYSDVLEENFDIDNKWVSGGLGFLGDVLLDPTTYLTGGIAKASKLDDLVDAGKAVGKAGRKVSGPTALGINRAEKAGQFLDNARFTVSHADRVDAAKALNISLPKATPAELEIVNRAARSRAAANSGVLGKAENLFRESISTDEAEKFLLPELEMKFMGKRIFGVREPENVNAWRRNLADNKDGLFSWANQAFSTRYNLPDGLNEQLLTQSGKMTNWVDTNNTAFQGYWRSLDLDDHHRNLLIHAVDEGVPTGIPEVDDAYNKVTSVLDLIVQREKAAGLHDLKTPNNELYFPILYRKNVTDRAYSDAIRGSATVGSRPVVLTAKKKHKTLSDATNAGNTVVEDMEVLLSHRLADHQQAMAKAYLLDDVRQNFAIMLDEVNFSSGTHLDADLPRTIGGFDQKYMDVRGEYKSLLEKNGFVEHTFRVVDNTTGEVKEAVGMIPERIQISLNNLRKIQTNSRVAEDFKGQFDKVHGMWKAGATIMNPGHHVRNLIGDAFLSWEGGGFNPRSFAQAMRVIGKRTDDTEFAQILNQTLGSVPSRNIRLGDNLTMPDMELYRKFQKEGLGTGFFQSEVTSAHTAFGGRALEAGRQVAGTREDITRFAHYLTKMKEYAKNYDGVPSQAQINRWSEQAAGSVRKFLFDYSDLTSFESNVIKRFSSFYTFMRKNLPLQLEMIFLQPGKLAAVPKAISAVQELLGTDNLDARIEHRIPDWMREEGNIIVGGEEGNSFLQDLNSFGGLFDNAQGPQTMNLELPIQEALDRWNGIVSPTNNATDASSRVDEFFRMIAGVSNPVVNTLAERSTGGSTFTGGPVEENAARYGLDLLPAGRLVGDSGVLEPVLGEDFNQSERFGEQLRSWLTGLSSQTATPGRMLGEQRRQEDVLRALLEQLGL